VEYFAEAVEFLAELGADVNVTDNMGVTPLMSVCMLGNEEIAKILLRFGANPNHRAEIVGDVLLCAICSGNANLVDLLLGSGADKSYVQNNWEELLHFHLPAHLPKDKSKLEAVLKVLEKHGLNAT